MSTRFSATEPEEEEAMTEFGGADLEKIARGVRLILEGVGEDPERPGLQRTPQRGSRRS